MATPPAPPAGLSDSTYVIERVIGSAYGLPRTSSLWNVDVSTRTDRVWGFPGLSGIGGTKDPSDVTLSLKTAYV